MMLDKTTDTTVRGVVYEVGSPAGIGEVERAHELNEIPYALLREEPRDLEAWLPAARAAIDSLLAARR
jgi:hypothetical protein